MSKESVSLPTVISPNGIEEIIIIVGKATGIYLTTDLIGGHERVNRNGKIAKRIKRNLKRELGVDLDNSTLTGIGNAVNKHSLKDDTYLVEYVIDLFSIVGKFADGDSCFQEGHQNYHHLLCMADPDANISAFCIYRSSGRNLGRAWCFTAEDGAKVYFNAYGLELDKIGKLASALHNEALREGYIRTSQDIWLNRGGSAYIVGGNADKTNYMATLKSPDTYAPHRCANCERPIWNANVYTTPDNEEWCPNCFQRHYWNCERCQTVYRHDAHAIQRVYGSRQYDHVCLPCAELHYSHCTHCDMEKAGDEHGCWFMRGRLTDYTTREGDTIALCRDHYRRHTLCFECGNIIEPGTALDVNTDRYETLRACTQCVHDSERIVFCLYCNGLTVDRYGESCRRCRGNNISHTIALIVQGSDETQAETDPAELVAEDTAAGGVVSFVVDTTTTRETGTAWRTDEGVVTIDEMERVMNDLDIQIQLNNAPDYAPEPYDIEPDPENLEADLFVDDMLTDEDGNQYRFAPGCQCRTCLAETERRNQLEVIF
jgi:hypothetical protein